MQFTDEHVNKRFQAYTGSNTVNKEVKQLKAIEF